MSKIKGTLCIDVSTVPLEAELFFRILKEENTIFYDSRMNPAAIPPYAIRGERGDVAILDIANPKIKAKFDLLIKVEELEEKDVPTSTDNTTDKDKK